MTMTVRIPWSKDRDNEYKWTEVCTWAIERFGLPGEKFCTVPTIDYMDFIFKSDKDALMMSLMWNGKVVTDDELTVEHVGKYLI